MCCLYCMPPDIAVDIMPLYVGLFFMIKGHQVCISNCNIIPHIKNSYKKVHFWAIIFCHDISATQYSTCKTPIYFSVHIIFAASFSYTSLHSCTKYICKENITFDFKKKECHCCVVLVDDVSHLCVCFVEMLFGQFCLRRWGGKR